MPARLEFRGSFRYANHDALDRALCEARDMLDDDELTDLERRWMSFLTRGGCPGTWGVTTIDALVHLLDGALPNHIYQIEQTARVYTIRGDLWDYLYDRRRAAGGGTLLSLTLEMGSWSWVRKSPRQALSTLGRFNPIKPHRHRRALRRHLPLFDLLLHAAASYRRWLP